MPVARFVVDAFAVSDSGIDAVMQGPTGALSLSTQVNEEQKKESMATLTHHVDSPGLIALLVTASSVTCSFYV